MDRELALQLLRDDYTNMSIIENYHPRTGMVFKSLTVTQKLPHGPSIS
jgi:hypothetical protein